MTHPFTLERGGKPHQLVKHHRDRHLPPHELALRPWYLRLTRPDGTRTWKKIGEHHELEAAVSAARQLLIQARAGGNKFEQLLEATRYRSTITVGALVTEWIKLGCPERNGQRRTEDQQRRQKAAWRGAATWWTPRAVSTVDEPLLNLYAVHRRADVQGDGDGGRTVDLELVTLSNCCQWAAGLGRITRNPFEKRPRFHDSDNAARAWRFMPADAAELHRICALLMAPVGTRSTASQIDLIAGAQLLFMALTGLRSGEPGFLRHDARRVNNESQPGHRYHGRRHEHLAVHRLKAGTNPAVEVHPALKSFLDAWLPYVRATWPTSPWFFPDPTAPEHPLIDPEDGRKRLGGALNRAASALRLPERHPHAMRAFYVRVRRSQGTRDAVIAEELGQGSGPRQIRQSYGDPKGCYDCGQFDWLDAGIVKPAWEHIIQPKTNLLSIDCSDRSVTGPVVHLESKQESTSPAPQSTAEHHLQNSTLHANDSAIG